MKKAGFFLLFLLCVWIELLCLTATFICKYLNRSASYIVIQTGKAKRRLCLEYILLKRKKANRTLAAKEIIQTVATTATGTGVVGKSKTVFITELPVVKSRREIKPFKSEPLEQAPQGDVEEDVPGGYDVDTAPVEKAELDELGFDGFEQDEDEKSFVGSSSGISFEELSGTIGILDREALSDSEKQRAAAVLHHIDGTDLFNFIAMNDAFSEKARVLMATFKEGCTGDEVQAGFAISEYMD